ncbi:Transcription factor spt8 [Sporothrix bragantina]|uniref:Transcription factor spt8 n=1 Tax=Sporothrix bragantina TaxID=671064 RepID=A0ABP0CSR5_9PEZI
MDEDDRDSNAFSENDQDEVMEDVDEPEAEPEPEPENEAEEDEDEADEDDDADPELDSSLRPNGAMSGGANPETSSGGAGRPGIRPEPNGSSGASQEGAASANSAANGTAVDSAETMAAAALAASRGNPTSPRAASFTPLPTPRLHLRARPEALSAKIYDIVPTMAAPQATSINALAVTPDLRYWMTGGSDGYIRKYDGPGTINGRQLLTVAQRHPFVDSVVKAGILMSYWENEEPPSTSARVTEEHILSPVYSLAVHSRALWLLAGTESGGINLQSVRHDEGKRITCLQRHTNAVSVLQLAPDEKSVLSGSWDKAIFDWDLNTGQTRRQFDGYTGQISAIELRPASGAPIPAQGPDEEHLKDIDSTLSSSNSKPLPNGVSVNGPPASSGAAAGGDASASGTSATINGDDPLPDHESLFGSPGGSLFGGSDAMGAIPFEDDDMGMASGSGAIGEDVGFAQDVDMSLDTGDATIGAFASTATLTAEAQEAETAQEEGRSLTASGNVADTAATATGDQMLQVDDPSTSANTQVKSDDVATLHGASTDKASSLPAGTGHAETASTANVTSPLSQQQQQQQLDQELQHASHDILRLYDIQQTSALPHSNVPFLIIPGPPRPGVISHLYIDQTSRFMISTAGTRGWEGTNTEALIGYEINSILK